MPILCVFLKRNPVCMGRRSTSAYLVLVKFGMECLLGYQNLTGDLVSGVRCALINHQTNIYQIYLVCNVLENSLTFRVKKIDVFLSLKMFFYIYSGASNRHVHIVTCIHVGRLYRNDELFLGHEMSY